MPNDSLAPQAFAIAMVFLLLGGTLWWLRRRGLVLPTRTNSGERRIQLIQRLALGPQHSLHLVRFDDRVLLVACSAGSCRLLEAAQDVRRHELPEDHR